MLSANLNEFSLLRFYLFLTNIYLRQQNVPTKRHNFIYQILLRKGSATLISKSSHNKVHNFLTNEQF